MNHVPKTRRRARLAAAGASALCALLLAGCHASATVAIRVRHDGRGTVTVGVTLDREARLALAGAALNPGASTPDVPLDDLRTAGWTVSPWRPSDGGGSSVQLSKGFTGGEGLASVLAELDGERGALRDAHVGRERSLLRDRDSVSLLADLGHVRVGVIDDDALAERLRAAGVDVEALDAGLQARVKGSFDLTVRVSLPDGNDTTVRVAPGEQRRVAVASTTDPGRRFALIAAATAALLGLGLFVVASADPPAAPRRRGSAAALAPTIAGTANASHGMRTQYRRDRSGGNRGEPGRESFERVEHDVGAGAARAPAGVEVRCDPTAARCRPRPLAMSVTCRRRRSSRRAREAATLPSP